MKNTIIHGDCLEVMNEIPAGSVDMILCDLPYGTTQNEWDSMIPLEKLWLHYKRVIKNNGAIVLTAQTPFDKILGCSNLEMLRYEWIWRKELGTGFLNANKMPLKNHENVLVFYKELPTYNPQLERGEKYTTKRSGNGTNYGKNSIDVVITKNEGMRHPKTVITFDRDYEKLHPTQKPIELFRYLIETYTDPGETILDNCIGSGTTAAAALSCGRNFIGIEKENAYVDMARKRLQYVQPVIGF